MVLSEMIKFLKYGDPTLYQVRSRFHLTQRDNHKTVCPKTLVPTHRPSRPTLIQS